MASILIRKLDEHLKSRLRVRAACRGRSMEEEAREILKSGLSGDLNRQLNPAEAIRRHIEPLGGVELQLPKREPPREPPKFDE